MAKRRYLTKSRFKLATECPTKLFYTGKSEYANQNLDDSFLLALADGGFQVGDLAKCYFPGGHDIKTLDYDEALAETNRLLQLDQVTIYEAAIATDTLFIRADILVKNGNRLSLYEVKAKSFDPDAEDPFANKNGTIKSGWKSYLYEVDQIDEKARRDMDDRITRAYLSRLPKGIKPSVRYAVGGVNQKILEAAAAEKADLIVIGRQGSSRFNTLFFGNTTERIARKAHCPVLIVPDEHRAAAG